MFLDFLRGRRPTTVVALPALPPGDNNIGDVDLASPLPGGEAHVGTVGGHTAHANALFQRPANATDYAALDAVTDSDGDPVPTVLAFNELARVAGGSGYITAARLTTNQATCAARFRLHLYRAELAAPNDNAPFTLAWGNRLARVGSIDFPACATEGAGSTAAEALNAEFRLPFVCENLARGLYGVLETLDAFTPAPLQQFVIELHAELN